MRMTRRSAIGLLAAAAAAPLAAVPGDPPPLGCAFALGVLMGFASFQAERYQASRCRDAAALAAGNQALDQARANVYAIDRFIAPPPAHAGGLTSVSSNAPVENCGLLGARHTVELRQGYAERLARQSLPLGAAYSLGVDLGIAEIQASVGDAARPVVIGAAGDARQYLALLQLPPGPLEEAFGLASGQVDMAQVHRSIQAARIFYQDRLGPSAPWRPANGGPIQGQLQGLPGR